MSLITKPMLASKVTSLEGLTYNLWASPKLDGIRCLLLKGTDGKLHANSRNFKEIPNNYIRSWLETNLVDGLDGELMIRADDGSNMNFSDVSSAIMSEDGEPKSFFYAIFDYVKTSTSTPFTQRLDDLQTLMAKLPKEHVWMVPQVPIGDAEALEEYLQQCLSKGYEGCMVRSPQGIYKQGRSSEKEGILLKVKLFDDGESRITGMIPKFHNENEATLDIFGHTERSSKKAGLVELDTLGALSVKDISTGVEFEIGTGFTQAQRDEFWVNKEKLVGKIVTYTRQGFGNLGKPRFPVFKSFRDPRDMDT